MCVAKHTIRAQHVPSPEWLGSRLLKLVAHGLGRVRDNAPGLVHSIGRGIRPSWTLQIVAGGKVFCRACTKGGPSALLLGRMLWPNNRIVNEALPAFDVI